MPAGLSSLDLSRRPRVPARRLLLDMVAILVGFAAAGAVLGMLWEWWWTPPTGVVVDHTWYPDQEGTRELFSGTATYVVLGTLGGIVLGLASAWFSDRAELVTLLAVAVASAVGAWTMYRVGLALAPPDPSVAARTAADHTGLPGTLVVVGHSPFVALPVGALLGVCAMFVGVATRRRAG